jgi:hypothetical protein
MRYGGISMELGRFQAKEITDEARIKKLKEDYIATYRLNEERYEEAKVELHVPDAFPVL